MSGVLLVPHHTKYARSISRLSSDSAIKNTLGLSDEQTSVLGTINFIHFILEQEKLGKQYSRVIVNQKNELIGVITLKDIDALNRTCHIGTWIGQAYWGKGYNQAAKKEILIYAFEVLKLENVFAGAKVSNKRSQRSQEKLPYARINVGNEFQYEQQKLEAEVKEACILNVIEKEIFLNWLKES
ncbi:GNAT family N-acetyltransferase [Gracilibacillus massiliensis]|uniref:GNAT family N-acetyltransferase n=1 Tax=Gracilibacillus massiliensis TaxID=1564956 RepID=UPI00071D5301|nr:GNAT family N-acetyltransferase [Gracilibacillus massiliensis]